MPPRVQRSASRLLAYVLILGAAFAYPMIESHTRALQREIGIVRTRTADLERARADIDGLRVRLERLQALSEQTEKLLERVGPSLSSMVPFSRRQLAVSQQALSRAQAEAWLRGFDSGAAGFLVVDAFSIKVAGEVDGLFDEMPDPHRPGQLLVSLKGEYIGRYVP